MHIYMLDPIDFGFSLLPSVEDILNKDSVTDIDNHTYSVANLRQMQHEALEKARGLGWEGDFTVKPKVLMLLPSGDEFTLNLCFIWKQPNNGSTFIASTYPILDLTKYYVE